MESKISRGKIIWLGRRRRFDLHRVSFTSYQLDPSFSLTVSQFKFADNEELGNLAMQQESDRDCVCLLRVQ